MLAQVIAAGSPAQVAEALSTAAPYREALLERGVLVVPLPIFEGGAAPAPAEAANGAGSEGSDELRCTLWLLAAAPPAGLSSSPLLPGQAQGVATSCTDAVRQGAHCPARSPCRAATGVVYHRGASEEHGLERWPWMW